VFEGEGGLLMYDGRLVVAQLSDTHILVRREEKGRRGRGW